MTTLSEFIRWARDRVVQNGEVANYTLVSIIDGDVQQNITEFDIDHDKREIYLISAMENEDALFADYDPDYDPPGAEE